MCKIFQKIIQLNILNRRSLLVKKQCSFSISTNINTSVNRVLQAEVNLDQIRKEFRKLEGGQISLTKDDESGIAYICLDHVAKKNGLSGKMMVDFSEAISALEKWKEGKAIILYGKGDSFCSGGYLDTVKQICNPEDGFKMSSLMQDSVLRLAQLPLVSVSIVHGKTLGGGAELILSTDFRLFTPSSDVRFVEANMGVGTGWGGGTSLRRLVGHSVALDLLLTCRHLV